MKKRFFTIVIFMFALLFVTGCEEKKEEVDFAKLEEFGKSDYNYIKSVSDMNYNIIINNDGKVVVNFDKTIDNVTKVTDIKLFSNDGKDNLYILDENGDIYKYDMSDLDKDKVAAKKMSKYENISELIVYRTRKKNAGGCDYLIAISNDNEYSEIDSFCH